METSEIKLIEYMNGYSIEIAIVNGYKNSFRSEIHVERIEALKIIKTWVDKEIEKDLKLKTGAW